MTIDRGNFQEICEQDLQELVTVQVPESQRLDYKLEAYGQSDSEKREFLKDVSALANTQGGHLVLGMDAPDGWAANLVGLDAGTIDALLLRLEQLARNGLEPVIPGLVMKAVPLATGRQAVVVRAPRSWNQPHRVTAHGSNRFYRRNSRQAYEPDVQELRTMFNQSRETLELARRFRDERFGEISHAAMYHHVPGNFVVLHIVPYESLLGTVNIAPSGVEDHREALQPIGAYGVRHKPNYYGYIVDSFRDDHRAYVQVFRSGVLQAAAGIAIPQRDGTGYIHGPRFEWEIIERLPGYINALQSLGLSPPLVVMLSLNVERAKYVAFDYHDPESTLPEAMLHLPEGFLEDFGDEATYHRALKPAFDALWNAAGREECEFYDDAGLWTGQMR